MNIGNIEEIDLSLFAGLTKTQVVALRVQQMAQQEERAEELQALAIARQQQIQKSIDNAAVLDRKAGKYLKEIRWKNILGGEFEIV